MAIWTLSKYAQKHISKSLQAARRRMRDAPQTECALWVAPVQYMYVARTSTDSEYMGVGK